MRPILALAVLFGCLITAARADTAAPPALPTPQVNIQQPQPAQPMPRPRVKRPDPPVKAVAVKKPSRPERHRRSKRRPEKPKQVAQRPASEAKAKSPPVEAKVKSPPVEAKVKSPPVEAKVKSPPVEAKAKSPGPSRAAPAKERKLATMDATSAVRPPAQERPPAPAPERQAATESPPIEEMESPPVATAPPTEPDPVPEHKEVVPAKPDLPESARDTMQTATAPPQPPAEDQDERIRWWTSQGSPAVVRFRDCVAAFAVRKVAKDKTTSWADLLIRAAEGDCREPFNNMARTLSARLGKDAAEPVIRSLIETTFLPAARKAVSSTQRVAGGKSDPAPSAPPPPR